MIDSEYSDTGAYFHRVDTCGVLEIKTLALLHKGASQ